jgi:hypothetical protein
MSSKIRRPTKVALKRSNNILTRILAFVLPSTRHEMG